MARKKKANVNRAPDKLQQRSRLTNKVDPRFKLATSQLCWARISSKSAFWPAMVIDPQTVQEQCTIQKLPVLYVVRYFDQSRSITFVTSNNWIKSWTQGVNDGLIEKLQTKAFKKAVRLAQNQLEVPVVKSLEVEYNCRIRDESSVFAVLQQMAAQETESSRNENRSSPPPTVDCGEIVPTKSNSEDDEDDQTRPTDQSAETIPESTDLTHSNAKFLCQCPKCGQGMMHYMRHTVVRNGMTKVYGLWACFGWTNETCVFPLGQRNFADYSTLRTVEEIAAGFFPPPPLPPPKSIPSISTQTNSATSTTAISEGGCYSKSVVPVVSSGSHAVEALESVSVAADRPATEQEQPIPKRCTNGPQKPKRGRGRPRRIAPCILSNVPAVQHMKIFDRHSLLLRKRKQQQSMTVEKKLSESNRPTTEERQFVPFAVDDPGNRLLGGWKSAATASSGPDVIGRFASPLQPPPLGTGANRVFQDPELNALVKRHITQVKRQLAPPPSPTALYGIRQGQSAPLINSDTFCELVPIAYQLPTQANNADSSLPSSAAAYWSSQKVQFPPTAVDDWSKAAVGCAVLGDWETPTAPTIPTTMIEAIESAATSRSADDQDADVADVGKSWEDDHSLTLSEYFGL